MAGKRTTCVYDGDTYLGTFNESGRGKESLVTVRYSGREMTAPLGSSNAQTAARTLLGRLVREAPSMAAPH